MHKTLDDYFKTGAGSGDGDLDKSPPSEPAPHTVFETFCDRALNKWKSQGILFYTLTINSKLKYKNKYLIRCNPEKQAKYFKILVKQTMLDFEKLIGTPIHYYSFFEYTKAGIIHTHGIIYPEKDELIFAYPYYASAFKKSATHKNLGFNSIGVHCEPAKSFGDVKRYISKDVSKCPITPVWG